MGIEFDASLETGIPLIDRQHKEYINRLNALLKVSEEPGGFERKKLQDSLNFLSSYAIEHFEAEETLMKYAGYQHMPEHLERHDYFRDKIDEIFRVSEESGFEPATIQILKELTCDWFLNHIKTFDAALGKFLKDKEAQHPGK